MALVAAKSGKTATSKGKVLFLENKNLRPRRAPQRTTNEQQEEKSTGQTPPSAQLEPRAATRSIEQKTRDEMLEAHMPLVRLVAERIHRRLPPGVDLESLIHSGISDFSKRCNATMSDAASRSRPTLAIVFKGKSWSTSAPWIG